MTSQKGSGGKCDRGMGSSSEEDDLSVSVNLPEERDIRISAKAFRYASRTQDHTSRIVHYCKGQGGRILT
jgi:hypothetical protein